MTQKILFVLINQKDYTIWYSLLSTVIGGIIAIVAGLKIARYNNDKQKERDEINHKKKEIDELTLLYENIVLQKNLCISFLEQINYYIQECFRAYRKLENDKVDKVSSLEYLKLVYKFSESYTKDYKIAIGTIQSLIGKYRMYYDNDKDIKKIQNQIAFTEIKFVDENGGILFTRKYDIVTNKRKIVYLEKDLNAIIRKIETKFTFLINNNG